MVDNRELVRLMTAIGNGDGAVASKALAITPDLARASLARSDEFFCAECHAQFYAGDTLLHAAAAAYDSAIARELVAAGVDVQAKNRRGAEPIHAAVIGAPGSSNWNPQRQTDMITYLIEVGADPHATALGGVTPLHRAVRNRCSAAVQTLLDAGADPNRANDNGSTAITLAEWTTGRSGSGSPEAKAEQERILRILADP